MNVADGEDLDQISAAITLAKAEKNKPSLIIVNTTIGYGSPLAGTCKSHGAPLGEANVAALRKNLNYKIKPFEVAPAVTDGIAELAPKLAKYESDYDNDMRQKFTHTGPHRDDIKLSVDGTDVRSFGSQGQQRTVALSLKLAEMKLLTDTLGTSPVLLLDDVFSELDGVRRNKLMAATAGFQSIITATDKADFDGFNVNIVEI